VTSSWFFIPQPKYVHDRNPLSSSQNEKGAEKIRRHLSCSVIFSFFFSFFNGKIFVFMR